MLKIAPLLLLAACFPILMPEADKGANIDDTADDAEPGDDTAEDSDEDSGVDTAEPEVTALEVRPERSTLALSSDAASLRVMAQMSDGAEVEVTPECAWSYSEANVAMVSPAGSIRGLGAGSVEATCEARGYADAGAIEVGRVAEMGVGEVVINELLADPLVGGDVNGDGTADPTEDEFVELVNVAPYTVQIGGATLSDVANPLPRHTFAPLSLRPGEGIVVFGGGTPSVTGARCTVVVADNEDSPLELGLALNNGGDTLTLRTAAGVDAWSSTYDDRVEDASWVLDPELDGDEYTHHGYVIDSVGAQSPCALATGDAFPSPDARLGD